MSCRANLLSSVALALALSGVVLPAFAQSNPTTSPSIPALTPAEQHSAFAPAGPQTEPASASPKGRVGDQALSGDGAPASTSALAPSAVGSVPVPAPAPVAPGAAPSEQAAAPDTPTGISTPQRPLDTAPAAGSPNVASANPAQPEADSGQSSATPAPSAQAPASPPQATPAAAADAGVPASEVSASLASRLAEAVSAKVEDAQAISDFYAFRDNAPIWIEHGTVTPVAKALLDEMKRADEDGLDPKTFEVGALEGLGSASSADDQARAEIGVSRVLLTYIRQASSGRVDTKLIGRDIVAASNMPDPVAALASIAIASDPVAVLAGYNPIAPQYLALKRKLAEVRANNAAMANSAPPLVPNGPTLKIGMSDTRVAVLRTRLGVTASDVDGDVYDEALQDAVRNFQAQNRIKPNGRLSALTVSALNASARKKPRVNLESEIIANMERWRWLPHDIGTSNVFVNVPEYKVRVVKDGVEVLESKVVVGKAATPTPIFSDTMAFVVMNPSWNVPQSIIKKEYMPKLADDPDYLARHGFVVTYANGQMQVRQPPGEDNALGHVKFMFPNNFSVYLHDTSQRGLFARDKRAFSHGCVRVDNPYKFAEIVMGADNGWTADRVENMVGGQEQRIDLKEKIPVHLAYFTAYVAENGELELIDDIYGYDKKVISALGLQS